MAKLGVNIDHVATVRQARREKEPSPAAASREARLGGANSITLHLREDRRHIQDFDLREVRRASKLPINLEMAVDADVVRIALKFRPEKVCLVPEKRQELTTEGGLNLIPISTKVARLIPKFEKKKVQVSLFLDPIEKQIRKAAEVGAYAVEIHTGTYANARGAKRKKELKRIREMAAYGKSLGLKMHAGHGLDYENIKAVRKISEIIEFNIGFSIVSRSLFVGMKQAVREMKQLVR